MERSELREDRAYDCGCNSGSPLWVAVGSLRKRTHKGKRWLHSNPPSHRGEIVGIVNILSITQMTLNADSKIMYIGISTTIKLVKVNSILTYQQNSIRSNVLTYNLRVTQKKS